MQYTLKMNKYAVYTPHIRLKVEKTRIKIQKIRIFLQKPIDKCISRVYNSHVKTSPAG